MFLLLQPVREELVATAFNEKLQGYERKNVKMSLERENGAHWELNSKIACQYETWQRIWAAEDG
jgi:hypothetical protein